MSAPSKYDRDKLIKKVEDRDFEMRMFLRSLIHSFGFRKVSVSPCTWEGYPDIWVDKYGAVIYFRGCFLNGHGCRASKLPIEDYDFWAEKVQKNRLDYGKVASSLMGKGYRILTVWGCLVKKMKEDVEVRKAGVNEILEFLVGERPLLDLSWSSRYKEILVFPD